jgi:hypothetical protein
MLEESNTAAYLSHREVLAMVHFIVPTLLAILSGLAYYWACVLVGLTRALIRGF